MLIGRSQRLNFSIQSVPNRLSVFFSTYAMSFFVIPFKVTVRTTSPKMFILSPVTERAVFFVLSKDGLFRRRHVCKFIIERSEPESSRNFIVLLKISTVMYLRKFPSLLSPDFVLFHFWVSLIFWHTNNVLLRVQLYHSFYRLTSFSLDKTSSSVGHHRYNMVLVVDFFVYSYFVCRKYLFAQFYFSPSVENSVSVCSWYFYMSNSRFLNSFRVTFNGNPQLIF